jgi:AmmeMemoRadiSam system protein B/AmmeMemoRadiSam system protein A
LGRSPPWGFSEKYTLTAEPFRVSPLEVAVYLRELKTHHLQPEMRNSVPRRIRVFIAAAAAALSLFAIYSACSNSQAPDVRPTAVSGQFYPSDPQKLKLAVQQFLKGSPKLSLEKPIAVLVPHAGYIYSGQICADAYRQAMDHSYDVIVILGTNHTSGSFSGISLGNYDALRTPLGDIRVDEEITSALLAENKDCNRNREVHIGEHSIEVQLPFLQTLFPKAGIVPVILYPPDYKMCIRFGETLAKVLKNRNALIVMSSDLSHYPDYNGAQKADRLTLETIAGFDTARVASVLKTLDIPRLDTRACGEAAILAGMTAAKALGASRAVIVSYANSGDALIGDKSRTVGYGAVVLSPGKASSDTAGLNRPTPPSMAVPLSIPEKKALLAFARESIHRYLTTQTVPMARNFPARMSFPQGAFVTLKKSGQLRGCIGHIPGDIALGQTVGSMALQAAFKDPRFAPVSLGEFNSLEIEISVLTPMKPVAGPDQIMVGRDGVLMTKSGTSAVFLPQVAPENNWDRAEMLDNLCFKAGLQAGCWKRDAQFQVFQAEVFGEPQFK